MNAINLARQNLTQAQAWTARNDRDRRAKALAIIQIRRWLDDHENPGR